MSVIARECPECEGSGAVYVANDEGGVDSERCDTCAGDGTVVPSSDYQGAVERFAERLAEDGAFDRWMRLAHLDRRNGTHEARDEIATFLRGGQ